jgi:pyruvate kinase
MARRRTKILATVGPATDRPGLIEQLVAAGTDGIRINCSHGAPEEWAMRVERARAAAAALDRQIAVVFDLQGPKIRLAGDTPRRRIAVGQEVEIVPGGTTPAGQIAVDWPGLLGAVRPGQSELIIGDGLPRFAITRVVGRGVTRRAIAVCTSAGGIGPRRGALVTFARRRRRGAMTAKDRADLRVAARCEADFIALSYVCDADDLAILRARLEQLRLPARVIAKVETLEAVDALADIVFAADAVMVARGDLGVQVGVAHVPQLQRSIVHACRTQGRLAIMATQMLESMVHGAGPTRAEATDIATAVVQGASALMLSAETAVGRDPIGAVRAMDEIAAAADAVEVPAVPLAEGGGAAESIMRAAALLGLDVGAAAYVVPTSSGRTVRALARHRPSAPIVALSHNPRTARQLSLQWGVVPATLTPQGTLEETIELALARAQELVALPAGAPVVVTSGTAVDTPGGTSVIALRHLPDGRRRAAD